MKLPWKTTSNSSTGTHHTYLNWWKKETANSWLERFSRHHNIQPITFCSVFGERHQIRKQSPLVFFSCENLDDRFTEYQDHLKGKADLRIGFEHNSDPDYFRFPLWLLYYTDPECHNPGKKFTELINREWRGPRPISCSLIARHDDRGNGAGLRQLAGETLQSVTEVEFAGAFNNNTDRLFREYDNHTNYYLRDCQFNICLENSNEKGYVTEKIWRPLLNGAIPIYWGADLMPEPEVLKPTSFIPFNPETPVRTAQKVGQLLSNDDDWETFVNQGKTQPQAEDWINSKLDELKMRCRAL